MGRKATEMGRKWGGVYSDGGWSSGICVRLQVRRCGPFTHF